MIININFSTVERFIIEFIFFLKCSIVNIFLIAVALSVCKSNL